MADSNRGQRAKCASIEGQRLAGRVLQAFGPQLARQILDLGRQRHVVQLVGSLVAGLVVTWALRPNIVRVLNGTERLVGRRAKRGSQ